MSTVSTVSTTSHDVLVRRHLRFGWWSLLAFVLLGGLLEGLYALRAESYVGAAAETRRLVWTLAHAHGTLLATVHLVFALTLAAMPMPSRGAAAASACLLGASVLLPGGFFLGGLAVHGGDPGLGILLVPPGALGAIVGVWLVARRAGSPSRGRAPRPSAG